MKEKILYLILGILIGAVITSGCFLIYSKNSKPEMPDGMEQGEMMQGDKEDFEPNGEGPNDKKQQPSNTTENEVSEDVTNSEESL